MWSMDFLQIVQILVMFSMLAGVTYYLTHVLTREPKTEFGVDAFSKSSGRREFYCEEELTVAESESFHKYAIWRYFRFSRSRSCQIIAH